MGLLEKVLNKPSAPKPSATTSQPTPATSTQSAASPLMSSPIAAHLAAPPKAPEAPAERPALAPADLPDDVPIPDILLPLSKRLLKKFKGKSAPKPAGGPKKSAKAPGGVKTVIPKLPKALVKGKRILAIDIGVSSIKVVELIKQGSRHVISGLEIRNIPIAMRKNPATLPILQGKLLREMLPASRFKGAEVHVVIPEKSANARTVSLPGGAAKELVNAIKFQIKKDLPFPLDVCEIAYRGFDPKISGKQEVEILAIDRRALDAPMKSLEDFDVLPSLITASSSSARFLVKDYTGIASGPGAVVVTDIGAGHTTITIVESDRIVLSRTVATGGDDFTSVLTGVALGPNGEELTDAQAEKYKIDVGLPADRDSSVMKVAILMRPIAERISVEINRSLDFYRRDRSGGEIKKMILGGGGSLLKRLPEFLSENVGVDVVLGAPAARLTLAAGSTEALEAPATEGGPLFIPALSVALDDGFELNMLPKSVKGALKLKKARGVIAPAALAVMILMMGLYAVALGTRNSVDSEYTKIKAQLKDLDSWRDRYFETSAKFEDVSLQLQSRQADYDSIRIGEPEIPRYLKAFSNLTPENVYLERMATKFLTESDEAAEEAAKAEEEGGFSLSSVMGNFTKSFGDPLSALNTAGKAVAPPVKRPIYGRVIEVEGTVYPQGTLTDVQLVDFVFNLENSGHFRDVAVDSMSTTSEGRVKFRILCGM